MSYMAFAGVTHNEGFVPTMADGKSRYPGWGEKAYDWTPDVTAGVVDTTEPTFAAHCFKCKWESDNYYNPEEPEQEALWHKCEALS